MLSVLKKNFCSLSVPLFLCIHMGSSPVPYSGKIDIRGVNYFGQAQFTFSLHDGNGTTFGAMAVMQEKPFGCQCIMADTPFY